MEIYCGDDCFPLELKWCLGVKYPRACCVCNHRNHSVCNLIGMVGIRQTAHKKCTTCGQKLLEESIAEFSYAVVALKMLDYISSGVKLGLVVLIGGDASLLFHIRKEVYCGSVCIVINR